LFLGIENIIKCKNSFEAAIEFYGQKSRVFSSLTLEQEFR